MAANSESFSEQVKKPRDKNHFVEYNLLLNLTHLRLMFPFLYSLKTPENQRFYGVFRGYKMGTGSIKWEHLPAQRKQ